MTLGQYVIGRYQTGEGQLRLLANDAKLDGTEKAIIAIHGHGGDATQFDMLTAYQGRHTEALADAGYVVLSIDAGGPTTFGNDAAMAAITAAYNWLTGAGKARPGKIGVVGWSMGGCNALNWVKRNPAKVAAVQCWTPLTDLDFFHGTAGYTPAYSPGSVAPGGYAAEIDAAYGGNYAVNAAGHKIRDEYASWRGLGIPIKVFTAVDDAVIPVGQSRDGFVAGVADANVTFRSVASGGHTGLFDQVPTSETLAYWAGVSF